MAYDKTSTFTSGGSWTCPPGVFTVIVTLVGGGGGGEAGYWSEFIKYGGGGGGGQLRQSISVAVVPLTTYTVTIGAGGSAPAVIDLLGNGGRGGTTSFGNLLTAVGGYGGGSNPATDGKGGASGGGTSAGGNATPSLAGTGGTTPYAPYGVGGKGGNSYAVYKGNAGIAYIQWNDAKGCNYIILESENI